MKNLSFQPNTDFSLITTAIRHSPSRTTAMLELTFASRSLRFTFRDPTSLSLLTNALNQLCFDADDPDDVMRRKIRTRVFTRERPRGSPDPAEFPPAADL